LGAFLGALAAGGVIGLFGGISNNHEGQELAKDVGGGVFWNLGA
jgi:hypothetical protein